MMKKYVVIGFSVIISVVIAGLLLVPNPLGVKVLAVAKAQGYLSYTPEEAIRMAYKRCTGCHGEEKILMYCSRCGPPFIVVAQAMKKFVELANLQREVIKPFTDAEMAAIIQVWNALVGNWEGDWRQQDIKRLLRGDRALISLAESPLEERPIELALKDKIAPGSYKEVHSFGKVAK